jgi:hypothetical protein
MNKLLKKDQFFEWTEESTKIFLKYKVNNFHCSSFWLALILTKTSFYILFPQMKLFELSILTQRKDKKEEHHISFMSKGLQEYELKYSPMEKQAFSLVKVCLLFQNIYLNFTCNCLCTISTYQNDVISTTWRRNMGQLVAKLQEYDIEINPLKAVKGQGLCKLIGGIEVVNIDPSIMNKYLSTQDQMVENMNGIRISYFI